MIICKGEKKKYCSNCGNELVENSDVCLSCGKLVEKQTAGRSNSNPGRTLGIISLFVWVIPLASWIVGGIGLSKSKTVGQRVMNIIGIILGIVMFIINIKILIG